MLVNMCSFINELKHLFTLVDFKSQSYFLFVNQGLCYQLSWHKRQELFLRNAFMNWWIVING